MALENVKMLLTEPQCNHKGKKSRFEKGAWHRHHPLFPLETVL